MYSSFLLPCPSLSIICRLWAASHLVVWKNKVNQRNKAIKPNEKILVRRVILIDFFVKHIISAEILVTLLDMHEL